MALARGKAFPPHQFRKTADDPQRGRSDQAHRSARLIEAGLNRLHLLDLGALSLDDLVAQCAQLAMLSILANRTYRNLFAAQVLSLIGTGLTTVALGLLAYEIAGAEAGQVLGIALAIKMIAYVGVSPFAGAIAGWVPRRAFLVTLDVVRAGMVLLLPFVTEVWQIYALVFLFQSCSAAFTPTFQATIPDVLPDEKEYTAALSMSRLAYDLESLLSPLLAALMLTLISFHWLFLGNAIGFLASGLLVLSVALPVARTVQRPFLERLTRGSWIYFATPRLRGLLALSFAAASSGAMVIVNTVVIVRAGFGGSEGDVAWFFAAYGLGSMIVALALLRLLDAKSPRTVMIGGALVLPLLLAAGAFTMTWWSILVIWFLLGAAASAIMTPAGILLRRSAHPEDRPSIFAAQFALSHAGWLVTYPLSGWLGANLGMSVAFLVLAAGAAAGTFFYCICATTCCTISESSQDCRGRRCSAEEVQFFA